eukprot:gene11553-13486_t
MTQALYVSRLLKMTPNDVSYIHTSLGLTYGLWRSLTSMIGGCQIVLFGNGEIRDDIQAPSPTIIFGTLPIYQWFMDRDDHSLGFDLSGLRYAFSCGIVMPIELRRSIYERYGFHIFQIYAATETGLISIDIYPNIEKYFSNRIYVVPYQEFKTVAHPFGGLELCVRSDVYLVYGYMMSGMKLQPIVDDEGWYHTGDLVEFVQDLDSPNNQVMLYLRRIKIARNTLIGDLDLYKIEQSVLAGLPHQIYQSITINASGNGAFYLVALLQNNIKDNSTNDIAMLEHQFGVFLISEAKTKRNLTGVN